MANTTSLWRLPAQPLPASGHADAVFVTVWLFTCLAFTFAFYVLLRRHYWWNRKRTASWDEFYPIWIATGLLDLWYLATVIDRWLHYDRRPVVLAYILFLPVVEMFKILSSLILVMATYAVVWKDLQCRFPPRQQGVWWFAAKMLLFVTGLLSLYYWVLKFALAIVWMRFPALNVIADVATKMTQLEIAMKGFFFAFGLLTVAASSAVLVRMLWDSAKLVGNHIILWLATLFLLARSTADFGTALKANTPAFTRTSLLLTNDAAFGLLTTLYLLCVVCYAWRVTSDVVEKAGSGIGGGRQQPELVSAFVRFRVVEQLDHLCEPGRESPPLREALQFVRENLDVAVLQDQRLMAATKGLLEGDRKRLAEECLRELEGAYGRLDPGRGVNADSLRSRAPFFMLGRVSRATGIDLTLGSASGGSYRR